MSKTSYALIGVIVAALLFMGAVRLREWRLKHIQQEEQALANDAEPFSFQHIPISLAAPQAEPVKGPKEYVPQLPAIFIEDAPLDEQQQNQQAKDTVRSILQDFEQEEALAQFNQDLQAASDGVVRNLEDLSTQNLQQLVQQNPQISRVVEKHLKNKNFSQIIDQVFSNPQFQQSVEQLQGKGKTGMRQPAK